MSVTIDGDHLFVQVNDETKQEYQAQSTTDFYSTTSSDECTFKLRDDGRAQALVMHVDGRDLEMRRLP